MLRTVRYSSNEGNIFFHKLLMLGAVDGCLNFTYDINEPEKPIAANFWNASFYAGNPEELDDDF